MRHRQPSMGSDVPARDATEEVRLEALLASVSTHTLLTSLNGLDWQSDDARIIIAELMKRLPPNDDALLPASGQMPTIPM